MEYAWLFAVGGGALILGLVMAFALMSKRRLTATEAALGREKTRQMYDGEKEAPAAPLRTRPQGHSAAAVPEDRPETPAAKPSEPGTTSDRPTWEGPAESRPRGYRPPTDDPTRTRDAAGETIDDPNRDTRRDAAGRRP